MDSHQTEKIPDFILLKESRKEVGQLKSEIDHLVYSLDIKDEEISSLIDANKKLEENITRLKAENHELTNGLKRENNYRLILKTNRGLNSKLRLLRANNKQLINELSILKNANNKV